MIRALMIGSLVVALTIAARSFPADGSGVFDHGSGVTLAFGFILLISLQAGRVFHAVRLPHLTGFILCGALFGPDGLGYLTPPTLADLALVKHVAVGLIALLAGCELNFRRLRPRLRSILSLAGAGVLGAFLLVFALFLGLCSFLPATAGLSFGERAMIALLCANALAAFSPPVVVGVVTSARAAGPLSELGVAVVVVADLAIVVTFSLTSAGAHAVFPGASGGGDLAALLVHVFGSLGAGAGIGAALALYVRRVGRRIGLFVFGVLFVVAEVGLAIHVDPLLIGIAAGLFVENLSPVGGHEVVRHAESAAMPTFAIFFSVIGAEVHLHAFASVAAFAVCAAVARAAGIFLGARLAVRLAGVERTVGRLIPFAMLPQAGIALALATLIANSYHPWGEAVGTVLLGSVVVNELAGPVLFRAALGRSGEVGRRDAPPSPGTDAGGVPVEASRSVAQAGG